MIVPSYVYWILIDFAWFGSAFCFSLYFLTYVLYRDQELKTIINKYIFSFTSGLCTLMLVLFLQEVLQSHEKRTSLAIWKLVFLLMDINLVFMIPFALIKDFWSQKPSKKYKNKVMFLFTCCSCTGLFLVAYVLYFKYIEMPGNTAETFFGRSLGMLLSTKSQLEFLTLIGIILNSMMQGYVCVNTIYIYLIQDITQSPNDESEVDFPQYDKYTKGSLYDYHTNKIQSILDQIAFNKRKQLKLEFELKKLRFQQHQSGQIKQVGFFSSWFGSSSVSNSKTGQQFSTEDLESEIDNYRREVKMLNILQKQYTQDLIDFVQWQQMVRYRQTLRGKVGYYLGKIVAICWIFRFLGGVKNLVQPVYQDQQLNKNMKMVLSALGLYKEQDEFYWKIIMQYLTLLVIGILIATNLQSFMKNFIVSLKNILKDSSVRVSYNSTILIFSFIMGTYYLSTMLQLSLNLPLADREAFQNLLDRFSHEFVLYTSDIFFIISCLIWTCLLYFNHVVNKTT